MVAEVVPAEEAHVDAMLGRIRQADIDELWASNRVTPEEALRAGLRLSTSVWTGMVDGRPICMFGVVPASLLGGVGVPWMIGTTDIERHQHAFLRRCRPHVAHMRRLYTHLANMVDARNRVAMRWLRWLGFRLGEPVPHGPDGLPFRPFEMRT